MDFWCRQWLHFVIFMTGNVPLFSKNAVEEMAEKWKAASESKRAEVYGSLEKSAQDRRLSMSENAQRGNLVFSALGFAVVLVVLRLQDAKGADMLFTKASMALFMLSAIVVLWMNSPKLKLFKYEEREPAGLRKLKELDDEFERYLELANVRQHRDMITFVERRALLVATLLNILGLLINAVVVLLG